MSKPLSKFCTCCTCGWQHEIVINIMSIIQPKMLK